LPVFGQLTPFPATPLFDRLVAAGRLTRPKHWMDFAPYQMAHEPLKMTIPQAQTELDEAWSRSYSPERNRQAIDTLSEHPVPHRLVHLVMRFFFRGIYFPQMTKRAWLRLFFQNRGSILSLSKDALKEVIAARKRNRIDRESPAVINEQKAA